MNESVVTVLSLMKVTMQKKCWKARDNESHDTEEMLERLKMTFIFPFFPAFHPHRDFH